jgi:hypothetical protein
MMRFTACICALSVLQARAVEIPMSEIASMLIRVQTRGLGFEVITHTNGESKTFGGPRILTCHMRCLLGCLLV